MINLGRIVVELEVLSPSGIYLNYFPTWTGFYRIKSLFYGREKTFMPFLKETGFTCTYRTRVLQALLVPRSVASLHFGYLRSDVRSK